MTQEQFGQTREPSYVPGDETEEAPKMTRFQKVASAILGDRTDRDEADQEQLPADQGQPPADQVTGAPAAAGPGTTGPDSDPETLAASPPYVTEQDEAAMSGSPISREAQETGSPTGTVAPAATGAAGSVAAAGAASRRRDYWDDPAETEAGGTEAAAVTMPDGPAVDPAAGPGTAAGPGGADTQDHPATDPDIFGTTGPARSGTTMAPVAEDQPGAATIADVPAGGTGRHAGGTPADSDLRPGQATGTLGDFSDLTYGDLIPDAAHYTDQWQQIQFKFVDDPQASVTEAADIIAQVTAKMEAAIQERQRAIAERQRAIAEQQQALRGRWGEGSNADTEALRETLRMYKTFLDQLIGSRTG